MRRLRPLHHLVPGGHRSDRGSRRNSRASGKAVTPYTIYPARIAARRTEAAGIHTFTMRFVDHDVRRAYSFKAGQFNMLYAFGVGEVPISIVSDPAAPESLEHTIRIAGRVTGVMAGWKVGNVVGVAVHMATGGRSKRRAAATW
jgi:NAD(P)H-flavin reductase